MRKKTVQWMIPYLTGKLSDTSKYNFEKFEEKRMRYILFPRMIQVFPNSFSIEHM